MRCAFSVDGELSVSTICFQTKCQKLLFKKSTIYKCPKRIWGNLADIFIITKKKGQLTNQKFCIWKRTGNKNEAQSSSHWL